MSYQAGLVRIECDRCGKVIVLLLDENMNGWNIGLEARNAFICSGWSGAICSDATHHCPECTEVEPLELP
jgi:hypothetical protein